MAARARKKGMNFEDVRRIALSFPGVEEGTSYGTPAFRVSRKFITRLHDSGEAMVMRVGFDEREMLMEREPGTYFITDHYKDYPIVLVRISAVAEPVFTALFERNWRDAAAKKFIREYDERS